MEILYTEILENQFSFNDLGINKLDDILIDDTISELDVYSFIIEYFNSNFVEFDHLVQLYEDPIRLKITATSLYRLMFVDIIDVLRTHSPKTIDDYKEFIRTQISDLKLFSNLMENRSKINQEIISFSILLDYINTDISTFVEMYWNFLPQIE